MATFEFSIVATGLDPAADDFESRFFEAGCDDAVVAFQNGRIVVDFSREADSLDEAVASAVDAVKKTGATILDGVGFWYRSSTPLCCSAGCLESLLP